LDGAVKSLEVKNLTGNATKTLVNLDQSGIKFAVLIFDEFQESPRSPAHIEHRTARGVSLDTLSDCSVPLINVHRDIERKAITYASHFEELGTLGEVRQICIHIDKIIFGGARVDKYEAALPATPVIEKMFLKKIFDLPELARKK
jgi:hypothetical protein